MASLWKTSKESSPLADGLLDRQPSKRSTQDPGDELRKEAKERERAERRKDRDRDRFRMEQDADGELLRRVERLMDEHAHRERIRVEDIISNAVHRVGDAFGAQMEALRRDVARWQSRPSQENGDSPSHAGSTPSTARLGLPPANSHRSFASETSRGTSPEAHAGVYALRNSIDEQRLRVDAQLAAMAARVSAMQHALSEVVLEQELQHIATGKFACTVSSFTAKEREASLAALNGREAAAKERLRRLRRPSKTVPGSGSRSAGGVDGAPWPPRRPSLAEDRTSEASSTSNASAATSPANVLHIHAIERPRRPSIQEEEDEQPLVELLPAGRGGAAASSNEPPRPPATAEAAC